MTTTYPATVREPLDRPRLLRLAIRSESVPAGAPQVTHGVVAQIEGGFFVAGPPATSFNIVALWAGQPPGLVSVGCVPTEPNAAVEVWCVHETESPDADAACAARMQVERHGTQVTLTCPDLTPEESGESAAPGRYGLVVDVIWEDG
jgi:hypothetical protein